MGITRSEPPRFRRRLRNCKRGGEWPPRRYGMKRQLWRMGVGSGLLGILLLSGCAPLGFVAAKVVPPAKIKAAYGGLQNHSVGIMVWADRGLRIDYPRMQLDAANSLQMKLQLAQQE